MSKLTVLATIVMITLAPCGVLSQGSARSRAVSPQRFARSRTAPLAPDIKPRALWDGRKEVAFHSLTAPRMVKASEARFLIDDEYVLGITENGESRAYPTRFVSWHHIINDRIGKRGAGGPTFVTVTYCIVCNSGMRFDAPVIKERPLTFDFYGLYNGVMTMYDRSTQSVWLQVGGRAVRGPLLGTVMKQGPITDTTWRQWKKLHPDTLVMEPDRQNTRNYESRGSVMVRGYSGFPADYFKPTVTHRDSRLPMFEPVLACNVPQLSSVAGKLSDGNGPYLHRAYPLKAFKGKTGVLNDVIGNAPVGVLFLADSETITAVSRMLEGRTLTLETRQGADGKLAFFDKETGSRWNVEGLAQAGPLAGRSLDRVDSHMSQWYGWVSYFPETSIYGQRASRELSVARSPNRQLLASRHSR